MVIAPVGGLSEAVRFPPHTSVALFVDGPRGAAGAMGIEVTAGGALAFRSPH
jgi:hypothetical protein